MVDDTTGRREQGAVDAASPSAERAAAPAVERVASGAAWQEGGPGFGVIKLRGLSPQGPVGDEVTVGSTGCNNHSVSISQLTPGIAADQQAGPAGAGHGPIAPAINVAWVESALGDISGIGRIMLQRCGFQAGGAGERADAVGLAPPANDNATWVADMRGAGALGCEPAVAGLDGGDTLVAWIGTDGNAHGRVYGASEAGATSGGAVDAPEYAAVNAALADLGPVVAAPDADRRVQVLEPRPGNFAVMWLALAESTLVLRGNFFVTPPATPADESPGNRWTEYKIADIRLPNGSTGEFSLKSAGESSADIVVTYTQLSTATNSVDVFARRIDGAGTHAEIGQVGAEHLVSTAPVPNTSLLGAVGGDGSAHSDLPAGTHDDGAGPPTPSSKIALDPGVEVTAPIVKAIQGGFVVAWQAPGALEGTVKITMALFDAAGTLRSVAGESAVIDVTDNAAAAVAPAVSGLGSGVVVSYVGAGAGHLVVEAFDGAGAQIGNEVVVDAGESGAISEIAIASQGADGESAAFEDQLAVVYIQDNGSADGGDPEYGNVMLQRYGLPPATETGPQQLVALGGDGQHDGVDDPVPLVTDGNGDDTGGVVATGRAPSVTYLPDGALAVIWVQDCGTTETIQGSVIQPDGEQVLRIDLTGLVGLTGIAEGTKPTLLDTSDGDIVVSWLQPDDDSDGFVVMAALYRASGPGVWIAPEQPIRLQEFDREPQDFSVAVSDEDSTFLTVTWRTDSSGHGSGDKVLSQRYDIDGNDLGWPVRVAGNQLPDDQQLSAQTLSAAGLLDGQIVVVYTEQKSDGGIDLAAQVIDTRGIAAAGAGTESTDTGAAASAGAFSTGVDQEIAIDVLASTLIDGLAVSRINGVPITPAAPVDVGSGWVQLREDGKLTVSPNAGFTGSIAFDYSVAGIVDGLESERHIAVNVEANDPQAPLRLVDPITTLAEDVSTAADIRVAEIAASDHELSTDGLAVAGLDADMFKIVGTTLYLKAGIDLDFETKPTLSVEIRAADASGPDDQVNFTLGIENASANDVLDSHASSDTFVFAPGLGVTSDQSGLVNDSHEIIDLSSSGYATFQQLLDSGALVQDGADVVITINPDDPAHSDKITLRGIDLSHLTSSDFKF